MNWLTEALRRIGVLREFTVDDMLNAESEDALVDHRRVLEELTAATAVRRQATSRLRDTLKQVSQHIHPFSNLDHQGD